jgi:hypothetical protein
MNRMDAHNNFSKWLVLLTAILALGCGSPFPYVETQIPIPSQIASTAFHTIAYFTGSEESYASLQAYSDYLDIISIDVFNVQDDGTIIQYDDLGAADYAFAHGRLRQMAFGARSWRLLSAPTSATNSKFSPEISNNWAFSKRAQLLN